MTMMVLRRLVPLKHAIYDVPEFASRSSSVVSTISETFLSTSKLDVWRDTRRRADTFASFRRFVRTSHHGESGARKTPRMSGIGQTHLCFGQPLVGKNSRNALLNREWYPVCP